MSFVDTEEQTALRRAVAELGAKYGSGWFSERARKGDVKARLAGVAAIEAVDDHTVDVVTANPSRC